MNELQQVLNNIEQDKNTNLLPGNLRDNVTCLGVEGTAEVPIPIYATSDYSIKELSLLHYGNNTNYIHHINNFYITVSYDSPSRYDKIYVDIYEIENDNLVHKYSYSKTFGLLYTYIYPFASKENTLYFYSYSNDSGTSIEKMDLTAETLQLTSIGSSKDVSVTWVVDSKLLIGRNYSFYFDISNERVTKIKSPATKYCGGYYVMGNTNLWKFDTNTISWVDLGVLNNTTLNSSVCFTKDGSKVFIDGNLYSVINDSVGELLKENVYNYENTGSSSSDRYLVQINDKYFGLINGSRIYSLYEFDNSSNTLTLVSDIDCYFSSITQDICSSSSSTQILSYYVFDKGNVQIGIIYDGNNLYFSSSEIGMSSSNVLQGTIMYDKNYNQIIGTMPNNGELNITPTTENQNIPEGYTSGGTVLGDENLKSENIKKDVSIFGVTGSLESNSGQIKLFETVEEMQADSTAQEGDLAVVYREEIQNMTADTQTQYITFPETVTLPEAFTDSFYGMLRAVDESVMFDGQVMLDQSMFDFNGWSENGMIRVHYTSSDGVTYTRDEFMGDSGDLTNPVDLGTVIKYEPMEPWNDTLGYFIQIGGNVFDGLYQAKEGLDYNYIYGLGNIVSSDDITYTENTLIEISNVIDTILENSELGINTLCFKMNNILYVIKNMSRLYNIVGEIGFRLQSPHGNSEQNIECATVNMDTLEVTQSPLTIDTNYAIINGNTKWYMSLEVFNNIDYAFMLYGDFNGKIYTSNIDIRALENNTLNFTTVVDFACYFKSFIAYKFANNQFTLTSPNQLLPNISAYGKNGNVIGDGTIWNNIPADAIYNNVLDIDLSNLDKSKNNIPNSDGTLKYNHVYGFSKTSNDFGSMCSLSSSTQYDYKSNYGVNIVLNNILYDLVFTENTNSYSVVEMNLDGFSYTTEDTGTFPETITDLLGIINYQNKLYLFCISRSKLYCYNYDINLHKLTNMWSISITLESHSAILLYDDELGKIYIRDANNRVFKVDVVSGDYSIIVNNLDDGYANSAFMLNNSPYFATSDETNGINIYKKSDNSLLTSSLGTSSYANNVTGFSFSGYTYIMIWNNSNMGFKINEADDTYEAVKFYSIFTSKPYQKMYQTIIQDEINKDALYIIDTAHSGQSKIIHFDTTTLTTKTMYSADNNAMEMIYLLDDMYLTINRYNTQVGKYLIGGITNLFNSDMPILINNDYIYTSIDNYNSVDYIGTISPAEYITAVATTEQILREGKT